MFKPFHSESPYVWHWMHQEHKCDNYLTHLVQVFRTSYTFPFIGTHKMNRWRDANSSHLMKKKLQLPKKIILILYPGIYFFTPYDVQRVQRQQALRNQCQGASRPFIPFSPWSGFVYNLTYFTFPLHQVSLRTYACFLLLLQFPERFCISAVSNLEPSLQTRTWLALASISCFVGCASFLPTFYIHYCDKVHFIKVLSV